jgi:hypothetical protein
VLSAREINAQIETARHELICAEDCACHRPVAVIRAEIAALRELRDMIPKQRRP